MKMICIGHKAPVFDPGQEFMLVAPPSPDYRVDLEVPDDCFGPRFHGEMLAEYTQLFALADFLKNHSADFEKFYIFQYRKFLALKTPSNLSQNMPYCYAATGEESTKIFPSQQELDALPTDFLLSPNVRFDVTLAKGYAKSHVIEDFVCLTLAMREVPGFDLARCDRFINSLDMIPVPSLGVMTAPLFIQNMTVLRAVWDVFSTHYLKKREGYQRRVGGFLLERLNSFLLQEQFVDQNIAPVTWGNQVTVSDTEFVYATF